MLKVFNCGIGMMIIIGNNDIAKIMKYKYVSIIGQITKKIK